MYNLDAGGGHVADAAEIGDTCKVTRTALTTIIRHQRALVAVCHIKRQRDKLLGPTFRGNVSMLTRKAVASSV